MRILQSRNDQNDLLCWRFSFPNETKTRKKKNKWSLIVWTLKFVPQSRSCSFKVSTQLRRLNEYYCLTEKCCYQSSGIDFRIKNGLIKLQMNKKYLIVFFFIDLPQHFLFLFHVRSQVESRRRVMIKRNNGREVKLILMIMKGHKGNDVLSSHVLKSLGDSGDFTTNDEHSEDIFATWNINKLPALPPIKLKLHFSFQFQCFIVSYAEKYIKTCKMESNDADDNDAAMKSIKTTSTLTSSPSPCPWLRLPFHHEYDQYDGQRWDRPCDQPVFLAWLSKPYRCADGYHHHGDARRGS